MTQTTTDHREGLYQFYCGLNKLEDEDYDLACFILRDQLIVHFPQGFQEVAQSFVTRSLKELHGIVL
ncbi:hypothetical protein D3C76_324310 [compost metagenome]